MRLKTVKDIAVERREGRSTYKNVSVLTPIKQIKDDGIFRGTDNAYSKMLRFSDLNYSILTNKEKEMFLEDWCEIINSFTPGATYKISIVKHKMNSASFKEDVLLPLGEDELSFFRSCYNNMLKSKAANTNFIRQELLLTISTGGKSYESAKVFLNRLVLCQEIVQNEMRISHINRQVIADPAH